MEKKYYIFLGILGLLFIGSITYTFGAATYRYERTLLPETASIYDLGTSTRKWNWVISNHASSTYASSTVSSANTVCIGTDCQTSWPSGTVTSIATTYPITGGPITTTGTLSLAFGTTTANSWNSLQTFTYASTTAISGTNANFTNFYGNITGTGLSSLTYASTTAISGTNANFTNFFGALTGNASTASDLSGCTDCINATEIEDIYVLNAGDAMTGALTLTADNTDNYVPLTINQLDTTNNPIGLTVHNDGTGNGIFLDQDGNGIGLYIDTSSTEEALWVYSNVGTLANDPLVFLETDNTAFDQDTLKIQNDGTGIGLSIYQGNTSNPLVYLQSSNQSATRELMQLYVYGNFTQPGLKISNLGTGNGILIDQNGNGIGLNITASTTASMATFNADGSLAPTYLLDLQRSGTSMFNVAPTGFVGIATATPATGFALAVHGTALADDWLTYSPAYKSNALEAIKKIKCEKGTENGDWCEVDHSTLPEGVRVEKEQTYQAKIGEKEELIDGELQIIPIFENRTYTGVYRSLDKSTQLNLRAIQELALKVENLEKGYLGGMSGITDSTLEARVDNLEKKYAELEKRMNELEKSQISIMQLLKDMFSWLSNVL